MNEHISPESQNTRPHMDAEWRGYSAAALQSSAKCSHCTRGAPVLKWAGPRLREDKALVSFLVWANPTNLCFASPALQADAEVVAAALASPFYAEPPPPVPASCVLRFAAEELRASKEVVLAAVARSGYEFEFAGDLMRADAYVVAWAGAPVGTAMYRERSTTFVRVLKSGVSVQHMDENWRLVSNDDDCAAACCGPSEVWPRMEKWPELPQERPKQTFDRNGRQQPVDFLASKPGVCDLIKSVLAARFPLFSRVAPPVRDVLWPSREERDGVF
jgi:hypothetical protein